MNQQNTKIILLFSVFCIAVCGLVYELLAGTMSSYLLGDSVYQFSTAIGVFMSSMGLGSYLSRFIKKNIPDNFIRIEMLVGIFGGFSAALLFYAFAVVDNYTPILFLTVTTIGTLIGIEIPLVIRILKDSSSLSVNVSNVFTFDYIGALAASFLFPLFFVPKLGLVQTSFFFGLINVGVALLALKYFWKTLKEPRALLVLGLIASLLLTLGFYNSSKISSALENRLYNQEIIYSHQSPYQRIVLTRSDKDIKLFLDGSIQFSSNDEYRYHEALVHPAMGAATSRHNILVLGGGDGLAVREILKYPDVEHVTLVDLDAAVTDLFRKNPLLKDLNSNSLNDSRVTVINGDAWKYLEENPVNFDVAIIDLPDPQHLNVSRLYSTTFYKLLFSRIAPTGVVVTQATSPLYSHRAFWCIEKTLVQTDSPLILGEKVATQPYHVYVPSFGEWGFVMASAVMPDWSKLETSVSTRYLNKEEMPAMAHFPPDMQETEVEINTIDSHKLVEYYEKGWEEWHL